MKTKIYYIICLILLVICLCGCTNPGNRLEQTDILLGKNQSEQIGIASASATVTAQELEKGKLETAKATNAITVSALPKPSLKDVQTIQQGVGQLQDNPDALQPVIQRLIDLQNANKKLEVDKATLTAQYIQLLKDNEAKAQEKAKQALEDKSLWNTISKTLTYLGGILITVGILVLTVFKHIRVGIGIGLSGIALLILAMVSNFLYANQWILWLGLALIGAGIAYSVAMLHGYYVREKQTIQTT